MSSQLAVAVTLFCSVGVFAKPRIINGVPVPPGYFNEVVQFKANGGGGGTCTATLVGPEMVITAGHCAPDKSSVKVKVGAKEIEGTFYRHPDYQQFDYDVALVHLKTALPDIEPASIQHEVEIGTAVTLLGFGCTASGGGGGNDGILRMGESVVTGFARNDFVSKKAGGGALCFGDSGGPTFRRVDGQYYLVGISSKGNITDTNYSTYLSKAEVYNFLKTTADTLHTAICGITVNCDSQKPEVLAFKKPVWELSVQAGTALTQELEPLLVSPQPVKWYLDPGAPSWMTIVGDKLTADPPIDGKVFGEYIASLTARKDSNAAVTLLRLRVLGIQTPPTCTLVAAPDFIKLGESLTLAVKAVGDVTLASIDGQVVYPPGTLKITPPAAGVFTSTAKVRGPGGEGLCTTRYAVK